MAATPQNIRAISDQEWAELYPKLTSCAIFWVNFYNFKNLPKGYTPQDLPNEAIILALTGKRKWNLDKVDLLRFLKGIIRSLASHLAYSAENRKRVYPSDYAFDLQQSISSEDVLIYIREISGNNKTIKELLLAVYEGQTNKEIGKNLNMSTRQVSRLRKRIKETLQNLNN